MRRYRFQNVSLLQAWYDCKGSKFWKRHCLTRIALESRRLDTNLWSWCYLTRKIIFYPVIYKIMIFCQWCRWNYRSQLLHYFWATLYITCLSSLIQFLCSVSVQRSILKNASKPNEMEKGNGSFFSHAIMPSTSPRHLNIIRWRRQSRTRGRLLNTLL